MSVLLDTHAAVWLMAGTLLSPVANLAIRDAQQQSALLVSPISAWEAAIALRKPRSARRPDLDGQDGATWFAALIATQGVRLAQITPEIALEAARCPDLMGWNDPGDCFLVASAHCLGVPLVTRDEGIIAFAGSNPAYVSVVRC
ncbi:MAG: type II toxin-antitoxin system VapC family toxin [Bauldia sp.]